METEIVNAMTVDIEDYFQVSAFENHISSEDWGKLPARVDANTEQVLALFESEDVKATFFVLGWIAERYPELIKKIVNSGHELASHGYEHIRVINQSPKEFRDDVTKTKSILEDISGQEVKGYRAASYSIGCDNLWALDILKETGHHYSSSIYPVKHDHYGMPEAPRFAFYLKENSILEVPVTTIRLLGKNYPGGGGGFFRLFPYHLSRWAISRVNKQDKQPGIFYFHPWEIDPDQPKQEGISKKTRFRHYYNLDKMEPRLMRILHDFKWGRMDEIFLP
jgi:polysaccharide deacetylase family protein (PEP-CTERM system associated)